MSKEKEAAVGHFWRDLFQFGVYKRSQGRIVRQATFGALVVTFALAAWRLSDYLLTAPPGVRWGIPGAVLLIGLWLSYRIVNVPRFADFLISVEAEMNKVSWPSRDELIRSSLVVIFTMFILAAILFFYDGVWSALMNALGV